MYAIRVVAVVLVCLATQWGYTLPVQPALSQAATPSLAPMLENVLPSVVSIAVKGHMAGEENQLLTDPFFRRFFGVPEDVTPQPREFQAAGSGVIIDPSKGYVITNNHVVEHADEITVILSDGRQLKANMIGTDSETDIAVIQIPAEDLKGLKLGDSDNLRVGDYVVAVGNPFGLQQTVTSGIVSALGRSGLGIEGYESFIQTDASINPGNSGGALVNLNGELIGINSAIVGPSGGNVGIGFAIPINMAKQVMAELIAHGSIQRGRLGVTIQDLTSDLAKALRLDVDQGALIASIETDSPAAKAGLEIGDVIVAVDGSPVRNAADLRNRIGLKPVDTDIRLSVNRKGKSLEIAARLARIETMTLTVPDDVRQLAGVVLEIAPSGGVKVKAIKPNSTAATAGLLVGDIIVAVNQQEVTSAEDVVSIASRSQGQLLLQLVRNNTSLFIVIG